MSGSEIRLRRQRARLTQIEIASHVGVTNATVCRWELGVHRMHPRYAQQIKKVLEVYEKYRELARAELAA